MVSKYVSIVWMNDLKQFGVQHTELFKGRAVALETLREFMRVLDEHAERAQEEDNGVMLQFYRDTWQKCEEMRAALVAHLETLKK